MTLRVAVAGILLSFSLIAPSLAQAAIKHTIDIPQQQLGSALTELARQTHVQLVYTTDLVEGRETRALIGVMTPEEALSRLLDATGLRFEFIDAQTVTLSRTEAPAGAANSAAPSPIALEEVVVTAQKREERVLDVPISIVAMTSEEINKRNVTSIDDLSLAVPGLFVNSNGSYRRQILLRGISNGTGNSSLIGVYVDEASATTNPTNQLDLRTHDLDRVEVLRGPQGTLYGEGSVGGTIRFITKSPVLDQFSAEAGIAAQFTQDGDPGQRIDTVVNVPLVSDELGLRVAGSYDHQGGWIDQPSAGRSDFNSQNLLHVRTKLLWRPTERFTANAMSVVYRNNEPPNRAEDAQGSLDEDVGGPITEAFNLPLTPDVSDDYELYNLTMSYELPAVQILSATTYINQDKDQENIGVIFPISGLTLHSLSPLITNDIDTLSQELRLTSTGSGPWQWTFGGFFRDYEFDTATPVSYAGFSPVLPAPTAPFHSNAQSRSWAAFADTSYEVTERLTLGTGTRYFHDDQDFLSTTNGNTVISGSFHALSPRAYIEYKVTDQINTYASAAKGFRSGGFNNLNQPSYGPERVWTYELGTKMSLPAARIGAELAVFYSDYSNYQVTGVVPGGLQLAITSNAGDARVEGVELGITWRPVGLWTLSLNGNYLDTEFVRIAATASQYITGDPLDFTPKYAYTASVQRELTWGRGGFLRVDFNEQGRSHFRNRRFGANYNSRSDVIQMLNLHANVQWNDRLALGLFGQNLLDDRGYVSPDVIQGFAARSRPRNYGFEFTLSFD